MVLSLAAVEQFRGSRSCPHGIHGLDESVLDDRTVEAMRLPSWPAQPAGIRMRATAQMGQPPLAPPYPNIIAVISYEPESEY
jgi:hypothetical protein